MNPRRVIPLLLAILVLSSAAFAERFPVRQEFGQTNGAGRATIADTSQGGVGGGGLVVSNIGSSGEDGIEFYSGGTRGEVGPIRWMSPEFRVGSVLNVVLSGRDAVGAVVEVAFSSTGIEQGFGGDLDAHQVAFNPLGTAISSVTFTVRESGNPMFQQNVTVSQSPLYETSNAPTGTSGLGKWKDITGVFDHFRFYYPKGTTFDLLNGQTVVGDEVLVSFDPSGSEMVSLDLVRVLGTEPQGSTGEIFIIDWPAGMFGQAVASLGAAEVIGVGSSGLDGTDRLHVSNIGSSGLDGVYMHTDTASSAQSFALEIPSPPVASNKLFVGGLSFAEGDGSGAVLPVVEASYNVDSFFDVWPSTSSPIPSRMEYLLDDQAVSTVLNPNEGARLYTSVQFPYKLGYAPTAGGGIEVEVLFATAVTFQNAVGANEFCDGVRLFFPPDPILPYDSLDGIFLRAADLPSDEFFVTGIPNTLPPTSTSTWTSVAGLGSANVLSLADDSLVADNVNKVQGLAGLDGILVSWPHGNSDLGLTMSTRSKRPPPYRGHVTVLKAFGTGGDKANQSTHIATLTAVGNDADTLIEYAADMSSVGPGSATWTFYERGQLVGTETRGNLDTCFGTDAIPSQFDVALNPLDGRPTLRFEFPDARPITLIGGAKAGAMMTKADLIVVIFDGGIVTPFTDVTDVEWRGSGQGAMLVTEAGPRGISAVPTVVTSSVLTLHPAAPNPFNPRTVLSFDIRQDARVTLQVFDARGHLVRNLFRGHRVAGAYRETWDGLDGRGRNVASGTYFFRLQGAGSEEVRKAVLVR